MPEHKQGLELMKDLSSGKEGYSLDHDALTDFFRTNGKEPVKNFVGRYELNFLPLAYVSGDSVLWVVPVKSGKISSTNGAEDGQNSGLSLLSGAGIRSIECIIQEDVPKWRSLPQVILPDYLIAVGGEATEAFKKITDQAIKCAEDGKAKLPIRTPGGFYSMLKEYALSSTLIHP